MRSERCTATPSCGRRVDGVRMHEIDLCAANRVRDLHLAERAARGAHHRGLASPGYLHVIRRRCGTRVRSLGTLQLGCWLPQKNAVFTAAEELRPAIFLHDECNETEFRWRLLFQAISMYRLRKCGGSSFACRPSNESKRARVS